MIDDRNFSYFNRVRMRWCKRIHDPSVNIFVDNIVRNLAQNKKKLKKFFNSHLRNQLRKATRFCKWIKSFSVEKLIKSKKN